MKTILFTLHELGYTSIDLGKCGENKVREIEFDLRDWIAEYPGASVALYISQPNTTVYLAATKLEEGILKWPILNTYTATPGFGSAEIVMSGKNGERLKSATANIFVSESMSEDEQGEAPDYMKPYVDQVAENAAKAEKALEEIKNIGAQSGNMPTGGDPGQILAKKSNADYDTHWINPPSGGSDPDAVKSVTVNGTKHEPDEDGNVDLGTIRDNGGSSVALDTTLTQSGKAADAKATGDAVSQLSQQIAEYCATAEQLSALFLSPNYSARTVLFSEITTTSGNSTYTGTMDEDGYICAYVNTGASEAYPFMRILIDNATVFENAKGMTSNYLYRTTPLFPVKKGMAVEIQLGDYSVGGSTVQVRFYGVNR